MTKVVCLLTGDKYPLDYIIKLYRGLLRHTTHEFQLEVVTKSKYPGWWGKLEQFPPKERTIMLDVDLLITGNIDFLFEYEGPFCAWHDPIDTGLNGSVHSVAPGYGKELRRNFEQDPEMYMRQYYSDQEYLRDHTMPDYWPAGLIQSYKVDQRQDSPGAARIVVFHGYPKPHEIPHGWVAEQWSQK